MRTELKFVLFFTLILLITINPSVYGLGTSTNDVGFVNRYSISADKHDFEISVTTNFLISSHTFRADDKMIQFNVESGLEEGNLAEIIIPLDLFDGKFTILLDGEKISHEISKTNRSSIITIEFYGKGEHVIDITAGKYLGVELEKSNQILQKFPSMFSPKSLLFSFWPPYRFEIIPLIWGLTHAFSLSNSLICHIESQMNPSGISVTVPSGTSTSIPRFRFRWSLPPSSDIHWL